MGKHDYTKLDRARDELFSHMQRCDVLDAGRDHRLEWLDETMDYMRERYPDLSDLQIAQLEMFGREYLKPAIPHGGSHNAVTRERRLEEATEEEAATGEVELEEAREAA